MIWTLEEFTSLSQPTNICHRSISLLENLKVLQPFLDDKKNTEIVVNKPYEVITQSKGDWTYHEVAGLTFKVCSDIAQLAATFSDQALNQKTPILSATLPNGERIQIVKPPACLKGQVSLTIRRPNDASFTLEQYEREGMFDETKSHSSELTPIEKKLLFLKDSRQYKEFLQLAVKAKKNIILSGSTGSGKTAFSKTLINLVSDNERLISIENADELKLYNSHPNTVNLFYSANKQGVAEVTQQELLESSLRMKPDRVFVAELIRGDEAFYYLRNVNSGHPGSITTIHASSTALAFEQLVLFLKESKSGSTLSRVDIKEFLYMCVDIVIQTDSIKGKYIMPEIYYDPKRKYAQNN